jgi:uncharacterized protein YutE (UPF0331/DUF86 family)
VDAAMHDTLRRMKGCRNILVHEYGHGLDEIIFETASTRLGDFAEFKRQLLEAIPRMSGPDR